MPFKQIIGKKQLLVHLIEMIAVITPVMNENIQRNRFCYEVLLLIFSNYR